MRHLLRALIVLLAVGSAPVHAQTLADVVRWQAEKDAPELPKTPAPANAASAVPLPPILTWVSTGATSGFDVYFGTTSTPPKVALVSTATYQPAALQPATKYFWKIVARNPKGTVTGPVWSFTTGAVVVPPPVVVVPPVVVTPPSTSPDGTRVPPATQIVDAAGGSWTLGGIAVLRNGQQVAGGAGSIIAWCASTIYVLGTDAVWYRSTLAGTTYGWQALTAADPCVAPPVVDPPPPVIVVPPATPPPPTGATITIAWDASTGVDGYRAVMDLQTIVTTSTCCQLSFYGVPSGAHTFAVQAFNATGASVFVPSPPLTATVP